MIGDMLNTFSLLSNYVLIDCPCTLIADFE